MTLEELRAKVAEYAQWESEHPWRARLKRVRIWLRPKTFKIRFNMLRNNISNLKGRMKKGYGCMDLWSFDDYLARVISEGCRELAKTTHTYPCEITFEEWQTILNEIADGFEICYKHWDWPYDTWPNGDYMQDPKVKRAWKLFKKYFTGLWD